MFRLTIACLLALGICTGSQAGTVKLEGRSLMVEVDETTGRWTLLDKRSRTRWPSKEMANPGAATWLEGGVQKTETLDKTSVRLHWKNGAAVIFALAEEGDALEIRYDGKADSPVRVLDDALAITDIEGGYAIVPCREGLLAPADSGKAFKRVFGTSDYEGCHMNMLGFVKAGSALIVTWDNAYVFPELQSTRPSDKRYSQRLTTTLELRRSANSLRLMPLGQGDFNTVAEGYRHYAEKQGLVATLQEKINRDPHVELMIGA
ncbi:MAG: hypothetical protein PVJ86_05275, partial [Phycisphaerales bacterium]